LARPVLVLAAAEGGADEAVPVDDVDTLPGVPAVVGDGRSWFARNGIIA
jgi:hypothetical protein